MSRPTTVDLARELADLREQFDDLQRLFEVLCRAAGEEHEDAPPGRHLHAVP